MANLDNEEEVIDTIESEESEQFVENNEEENEVVNQLFTDEQAKLLKRFGVNPDNATTDDLIKLAERVYNSESKKVELKKQNKASITSREDIKNIFFEEKFYEKNPDAENYREKIETYQTINKLSLQDAYDLAIRDDKIIEENRNIYGKGVIKGNTQATEGVTLVSLDEYNNMTDEQINKYDSDMKSKFGVVKWK